MSQKTVRTISESFLAYLTEEGLTDLLPEIAESLTREADRRQVITIMSAAPLPEGEKSDLKKTLTAKWGEHAVEFTVDESLLSGMIIAYRDQVIDMSGRSALNDLSQKLS
ncbi:MAG TPA: F0F1 ATP synthase subunit delta [Verrucomicrobiae bacterium]|nr:F0F1 ATP synthase subunit delta [Verrucomicrobiae bacterium]